MKTISILLAAAFLSLSTLSFTACSTTGGVSGVITNAQAWLADPANQALINSIATTAITILGALGEKKAATTHATVTGKLAVQYPNVPAGALAEIAKHPSTYRAKTAQH